MYKNILVPYDQSTHAKHALAAALEQAKDHPESSIIVLSVVNIPDLEDPTYEVAARMAGVPTMSHEDANNLEREYLETHKKILIEDTAEIVDGMEDRVTFRCTSGKPHEAIVEFSKMAQSDLIVMGCRGLGAVRGMLGSVSNAVLRGVEIPVLVVK